MRITALLLCVMLLAPGARAAEEKVTVPVRLKMVTPAEMLQRLGMDTSDIDTLALPPGIDDVFPREPDTLLIRGTKLAAEALKRQIEGMDRVGYIRGFRPFRPRPLVHIGYRLLRVKWQDGKLQREYQGGEANWTLAIERATVRTFGAVPGLETTLSAEIAPDRSITLTGQLSYSSLLSHPEPAPRSDAHAANAAQSQLALSPAVTRTLRDGDHAILVGLATSGSPAIQTLASQGQVPDKAEPFTAYFVEITSVQVEPERRGRWNRQRFLLDR